MAFEIPANAARNADGSLQNPAAWGVVPGQSAAPGSVSAADRPAINWDTLQNTGFGGMYGNMDPGELAGIIARARQNYNNGNLDSNTTSYLNNRATLQNIGLVGQGQEADLNALFGGDGPMQNLKFGPSDDNVSFQDVSSTTNSNLARLLGAMGGGQGYNLGNYMTGFSGTPNYQMFGGLSASGVANQLRNGNFQDALSSLTQQITSGGGNGRNIQQTPYNRFITNPYQGNQPSVNTDTGRPAAGGGTGPGTGAGSTTGGGNPGAPATGSGQGAGVAPGAPILNWNAGTPSGYYGQAVNSPYTPGGANGPNGTPTTQPGYVQPPAIGTYEYNNSGPGSSATSTYTPVAGTPAAPPISSTRYNPDGSVWTGQGGPAGTGGGDTTRNSANNNGRTESGTSSTGGGNPFAAYVGGQTPSVRGAGGGNTGSGWNSYTAPGLAATGQGQTSTSLQGLGNLYNNLSSGQGLGATGIQPSRRRANNSMWGY